jgi:hypothetical protein
LALNERQVGEPAHQLKQRELRLEPAQSRANAVVDPLAEGERPVGVRSMEIELLGMGKDGRVAVDGDEPEE